MHRAKWRIVYIQILPILFCLISRSIFASDGDKIIPFSEQNQKNLYKNISFGMLIDYNYGKSLTEYIEIRLPNYNNIPRDQRLSKFGYGLGFFLGSEIQLSNEYSIKAEYNYYTKSISSSFIQIMNIHIPHIYQ